ncbi:MAG TPA: DUF6125 family protein [Syntrophorhabdaceae bacterium]|nr:DUF6125 family protein [Syntrophorhabdaceae bacterium]
MRAENKEVMENNIQKYLEFVLWHYKVIDGFWFLAVSEAVGKEKAEEIVEVVWKNGAKLAARETIKRFGIEEKGLTGFIKALKLFPMATVVGYVFEEKHDEVILTVPNCTAQQARLRHGLGEFVCKPMHFALFEAFAKEIDSRIEVKCHFAPPDPHPEHLFCKWSFTLKEDYECR